MLHAHPRVAIPPETRFVVTSYYRRRKFGDLRERENRRGLGEWIVRKQTRFPDLGLDADAVVDRITEGPPTLGSALGTVFQEYARRFDKPRWGDKRPAYHHHIDMLIRLFPDAQIVHLIRDGRDCAASLKRMSWWHYDFYHTVANWAEAIDSAKHAARRLPADSFYELYYENLISDPEAELTALCHFLGEDYDEAMTKPSEVASVAVPKRKKHHANTHKDITTTTVGRSSERLETWELALCESALGRRLRAHGYELTGTGSPGANHLARYAKTFAGRQVTARKRTLRDRRRSREERPVAALITSAQRGETRS